MRPQRRFLSYFTISRILFIALLSFIHSFSAAASAWRESDSANFFRITTKKSPNMPRAGSLRLTQGISFAQFNDYAGNQFSWRGIWDYHISEFFSVTGAAEIALHKIDGMRSDSVTSGINLHFLKFGDLGFFAGASGGLGLASDSKTPTKGFPMFRFEVSSILIGRPFMLGLYYHFVFTVGYHIMPFEANDRSVNLNHMSYTLGVGYVI